MGTTKEFVWTKENYNIRELLNTYKTFPIIVQVTGGYCGQNDIDTLSAGQVARIHEQGVEKRVLAMDDKERYLSIPGDYPIKFEVVKDGKKSHKAKTLLDIVKDNKLPVTVQFEHKRTWVFDVGSVKYQSSDFGILQLLGTYKQHFLKVNTIHDGVIDGKVTFIPLYIDVELRVAQGIKKATESEWKGLIDMYDRAVAHIDFSKIKGNRSIMLYPAKVSDPDWEAPTATARVPSNESSSGYSSSLIGNSSTLGPGGTLIRSDNDIRSSSRLTDTSASIVRMLPNMTLVMNLNKDELTSSLPRPTPSPRLESPYRSNLSDSITDSLDHKSLHSDDEDSTSTLTDSESVQKNIVRLKLGDDEDKHTSKCATRKSRSRSRSRSKTPPGRALSPSSLTRPGRMQPIGAPVAIFNDRIGEYSVSFPVRRAASLESMQDTCPSDAETTSSSIGVVPRFLKSKSTNYGMRFLKKSDREKPYSHSNPDLTKSENADSRLHPTGVMTTGRLPTRKNVSFSNSDTLTGMREVYLRDNLQVTVQDTERSHSPAVTYTRRPGMERAARVAFRTVSSNSLPRAVSPARSVSPAFRSVSPVRSVSPGPVFNSNSLPPRLKYRAATLPNRGPPQYRDAVRGRGVTTLPRKEYRTAPLNSSPGVARRVLTSTDNNWEMQPRENLRSSTSASITSETDSDVIYQGTLTLKRQQNGSFHAQRSMYQMVNTLGDSNYGTLSSRDSTPTPPQEYDPMAWADQEWRRLRFANSSSQIQNIPIDYDSDVWLPPVKPNGHVTMSNGYNGYNSTSSSLSRNGIVVEDDDDDKPYFQVREIKSGDGTVIRHEVDYNEHKNEQYSSATSRSTASNISMNNNINGSIYNNAGGNSTANSYNTTVNKNNTNTNMNNTKGTKTNNEKGFSVSKNNTASSPPPLIKITTESENNRLQELANGNTSNNYKQTDISNRKTKEVGKTDSVNSLRDARKKFGSVDGKPKLSAAASAETFTEAANRTIERYKKSKAKKSDTSKRQVNGTISGDEFDMIRDLDNYLSSVDDDEKHFTTL